MVATMAMSKDWANKPKLKTCFQPLPFTSIFASNSKISKSKSTLIDFPCCILYNNEIWKATFFICVPSPRKKILVSHVNC
jgi:hypothetical protein